jgi:hypothetical protein
MSYITILLTSTVISAIVSAVTTLVISQRKISIENITKERRYWRTKVRFKAIHVHDAMVSMDKNSLDRLRVEFRAILNPNDDNDNAIISTINLPEKGNELAVAEEFAKRIALLLKHDWERAKLESGPITMRLKCIRSLICFFCYRPERQKYY